MSDFVQNDEFNGRTVIKVVGVGGAGGNAVNRMISEGLQDIEYVAINTDAKDLLKSEADVKIALSDATSRGLGAGADPAKGAKAAQDHQSDIEEVLKGADMVFLTAGEGGGTGTGASPVVAHSAREQGALTIGVVTRPFSFEGPRRSASAESGIEKLRDEVDALIVIPNDRLLDLSDKSLSVIDAFKHADSALLAGVRGITDLITSTNAYINVDFSDVKAVLQQSGTAMFGIGSARGEDRAAQAAETAISSPLLESGIKGAHGVLVNVAGPMDMGIEEYQAACELIRSVVAQEAQIITGMILDDAYGDEVRVTVIAAGFDMNNNPVSASSQSAAAQSSSEQSAVSQTAVGTAGSSSVPPLNDVKLQQGAQMRDMPERINPESSNPDSTAERPAVSPAEESQDWSPLQIPDFLR